MPDTADSAHYFDTPAHPGYLHVVCGCMFAGKTEELLDHVFATRPACVKVFKHVIDDRYDARRVVSHRDRSCPAIAIEHAARVYDSIDEATEFVAIDEGHFFDEQLPALCRNLSSRGLKVMITALDRDSWGRPFSMIDSLRASADLVTVKHAWCAACGRRALRTQRLIPIIADGMVGGPEAFEPRCVQCWSPPPVSPVQITRLASNTGPCVQHSS